MEDVVLKIPKSTLRRVALITAIGAALIGFSILGVLQPLSWLHRPLTVRAYFREVPGLASGAAVKIAGFTVGRVTEIRLAPRDVNGVTDSSRACEVRFAIDKRYQQEIRSDSVASLLTEGLLGDVFVSISRGTQGLPIAAGGEIRAKDPPILNGECSLKYLTERLAELIEQTGNRKQKSAGSKEVR